MVDDYGLEFSVKILISVQFHDFETNSGHVVLLLVNQKSTLGTASRFRPNSRALRFHFLLKEMYDETF